MRLDHISLNKTRLTLGLCLVCTLWGAASSLAQPKKSAVRHSIDSDGHSLALWEKRPEGQVKGAILLIHGRTWSALPDFDLQVAGEDLSLMDGIVEQGFAAYALDLRGYGATQRDATGWATPFQSAADVHAALLYVSTQEDGVAPFLFGWSNGSMVAQLTAQKHPEALSGLVLFGYPIRPDTRFEPQDLPSSAPSTRNTAKAAASDFITEGSISERAVQAYVRAALAADPIRVEWRHREQWKNLDPGKILVPVLLIQGEFDPLSPTQAQASFFSRISTPEKEWVVIPGGDHAAFLESPRPYFLTVLTDFLNRHPISRTQRGRLR